MPERDRMPAPGEGQIASRGAQVLETLRRLRAQDAPTHGGRVLSYVYDSGLAELDRIAGEAARLVQSVNGLDPTVFPSVAVMERELVAFGRNVFHGDTSMVGNVTTGGTESCLLAVKAARDLAAAPRGTGSLVIPTTAHAAFVKAAALLGLELIRVPVDPATGVVDADRIGAAIRPDTVLVVVSAPNYPTGSIDPVAEVAAVTGARGVALHVDACLGGFALPWWDTAQKPLPPWDFRVEGVTSLSADLHKYGYAPKGASLLLHRDRDRHRAQYFGITDWPGYPVVNPTLLGSKSAAGLASAWAVATTLGPQGYAGLVAGVRDSTDALVAAARAIDGLRVVGEPVGPVFAVAADVGADDVVDPHRWASAVQDRGFTLQMQPSLTQPDGTVLASTTHVTVTGVTASILDELIPAFRSAADMVRGEPPATPPSALAELAAAFDQNEVALTDVLGLPSESAGAALVAAGLDPRGDGDLDMATVLAAVEALPRPVTAKLLVEFLAGLVAPD
ncbi:MAG: aspartate aminotransferase family protein [Gordonia sp.]|nr:aspartate aminotransferase family protein [Gordonia sp. (in: high G+C Gram-positive bacteria)]